MVVLNKAATEEGVEWNWSGSREWSQCSQLDATHLQCAVLCRCTEDAMEREFSAAQDGKTSVACRRVLHASDVFPSRWCPISALAYSCSAAICNQCSHWLWPLATSITNRQAIPVAWRVSFSTVYPMHMQMSMCVHEIGCGNVLGSGSRHVTFPSLNLTKCC